MMFPYMLGGIGKGRVIMAPLTSYSNSGGTGNRTGIITVTANFTPSAGTVDKLVDGGFVGNASNSILVGNGVIASGKAVTFDLQGINGGLQYIDEVTLKAVSAQGVSALFQGSLDGTNWVTLCDSFSWTTATQAVSVAMRPEGYRYIQFEGLAGSFPNVYWTETEFKIAPGAI